MSFSRSKVDKWHMEVPGARWFKSDLHVHTIDDLPGGRARIPNEINGLPDSSTAIEAYARSFLSRAATQGIRVLGLTPHSPRTGSDAAASAVWAIVDQWNIADDDDGVPFREKLYAVFPGFEPSLKQGRAGLHLLFLFDPEIGRANYLKAFDLIMGGVSPWRDKTLQVSNKTADVAFRELKAFHDRECHTDRHGRNDWNYMVLAPHIDSSKGLLEAQKAQILELFEHNAVSGLELGDEKLPESTLKNRPWLKAGMAKHRQAFFHASDAYALNEIGARYTWVKLASPRIEALRQALVASDSRIRIAYERNSSGALVELADPPDGTVTGRPWLKSVTVTGRASFFGAVGGDTPGTRFELSPDLTCIIGGSMTGKSTFLDGLRVHLGAPLPQNDVINEQVVERGRLLFLAGSAEVKLECPGQDPTASDHDRWPAEFFAQNELQRLVQAREAVQELLARLVPSEMYSIQERAERLAFCDKKLSEAARHVEKFDEDLAEADQAFERSESASLQLKAFAEAGVENLHQASRDLRNWQQSARDVANLQTDLERASEAADTLEPPEMNDAVAAVLREANVSVTSKDLGNGWDHFRGRFQSTIEALQAWNARLESIIGVLRAHQESVRKDVNRILADRGFDGARIEEFQALSRRASLRDSYKANLVQARNRLKSAEQAFDELHEERQTLVGEQRKAYDRVITAIRDQFDGRILARRIDSAELDPLDDFLRGLGQRGITRWWNDLDSRDKPSPDQLLEHLKADTLATVGMSMAVQSTFRECMTRSQRRRLAAVRCSDDYFLELKMDDGNYRRLDRLSGGQRVSLLLSLLLQARDSRPLVIDQPEDELDNRFLFDTVLPALKRLKGRRQIIVATHDANIVVNGDADQVIQLEATANRGRIAYAGAIEEPAVRDAIVRTVDGGDEAFRLRRLKYGY